MYLKLARIDLNLFLIDQMNLAFNLFICFN